MTEKKKKEPSPVAINFLGKPTIVDRGMPPVAVLALALLEYLSEKGSAPNALEIINRIGLVVTGMNEVLWPPDYQLPSEPEMLQAAEVQALKLRVEELEQYIADHNGEKAE